MLNILQMHFSNELLLISNMKTKQSILLGIIKIIIIFSIAIFLIGNFVPFFQGGDTLLYGGSSVKIANGNYEYTNKFIQETTLDEFVSAQFVKTIHDSVIPIGGIGIYVLSALSYLTAGYYGLFYLGPIITIILFIVTERVTTKLFGGFAGLVALILLASDEMTGHFGLRLLTDNIFTMLTILGGFFLIKYLQGNNERIILYSSIFLTSAAFFRYNGIVYLPLEILLIVGFFCFQYLKAIKQNKNNKISADLKNIFSKDYSKLKKILKIIVYLLTPWLVFVIFLSSYNAYFFGDPFTNYVTERRNLEGDLVSSFFTFDSERLDSIISYSSEFFPDSIKKIITNLSFFPDELLNENLMSVISISVLAITILIAFYFKIKRIEIIVFSSLIVSLLLFYSSGYIVQLTGIVSRFMLSTFPFIFAIFGYLMYQAWKINFQKLSINYSKKISKSWKLFLIIVIGSFLISSLVYSPVNQIIIKQKFDFNDPQSVASRYPLDMEGLSEESIIVDARGRNVIEFNSIPFDPFKKYSDRTDSWKNEEIDQKPISIMKELIISGEELYVFKKKTHGDPLYFKYLEDEHGIILKDFSKTFCKMILSTDFKDTNDEKIQSDSICYFHS